MKVKELMTKPAHTITEDTPLRMVNQLMQRYHLNDLVVVNENYEVKGIITYSDLYRLILPTYVEVMEDETIWLLPETVEEKIANLIDKPVKSVMTKDVFTVSPSELIVKAGAMMSAKKIKQVPVVKNNKLIGILSYRDILWGFLIKNCKYL